MNLISLEAAHSLKNNQKVHGYKLHIRNYKTYANPATNRYQLTPVRMAIIKKCKIINAGGGVEEREPLYTVCRNVNWCGHYGNSMEIP